MEKTVEPVKVYWFSNFGTWKYYDLNDEISNVSKTKYKFKHIDYGGRMNTGPLMVLSVATADVVILYYCCHPVLPRNDKEGIKDMLEKLAYVRKEPVPVLVVLNEDNMSLEEPVRGSLKLEHGFTVETVSLSLRSEKDARLISSSLEDVMKQSINLEGYFPQKHLSNGLLGYFFYLLMGFVFVLFGDVFPWDKSIEGRL